MRDENNTETHEADIQPVEQQGGNVFARIKRRWQTFSRASMWEIASEMLARFLVGLTLGAIACVVLVPVVFWPSRHNPRPMFDEISDTAWAKWLFAGVLFVPAIIGALSTMLGSPAAGFLAAIGMKKRAVRHQFDDGTIVIGEETEPPTSLLRRTLGVLWEILTWVISCAPGLFIILGGIHAIDKERITGGRSRTTMYGAESVGFGWILVAFGIWALGEGIHIKTERPIYRWISWALAAACLVKGICVLIFKTVLHS